MLYHRYRSSSSRKYRPPTSSPWQRAGETMSLANACAHVGGITEEECHDDPNVEIRMKSFRGNVYPAVIVEEVMVAKNRLDREKEEAAIVKLKAELGEEGYKKKIADAKKAQEDIEVAALAASKRKSVILTIKTDLQELQDLGYDPSITIDGDDLLIGKTAAKKDWCLKNHHLEKLVGITKGRSTKYKLLDLIGVEDSNRNLTDRLKKRGDTMRLKQYATFLKTKLLDGKKYNHGLVQDAVREVASDLGKEIKVSENELSLAQAKVIGKKHNLMAFQNMRLPDGDARNGVFSNVTNVGASAEQLKKSKMKMGTKEVGDD